MAMATTCQYNKDEVEATSGSGASSVSEMIFPPESKNATAAASSAELRTIASFEISNFNLNSSKEMVEEHIYEWNLDGYFYPIANFLGLDKIIQVPDHADVMEYGENHAQTALSIGVLTFVIWVIFKIIQHLPTLLHQMSIVLNFYKRKRRRRFDGKKIFRRKSNQNQHQRYRWGWGDHNHHRLDNYYTTLVASRDIYENERYNKEMLHELLDNDLPQLVAVYD